MTELAGFKDTGTEAWNQQWFGDPIGILCRKLKLVKGALVKLNKLQGNAHTNVQEARTLLHNIEELLVADNNNTDLLQKEKVASSDLEKLLKIEEDLYCKNQESNGLTKEMATTTFSTIK